MDHRYADLTAAIIRLFLETAAILEILAQREKMYFRIMRQAKTQARLRSLINP